MYLIIIILKQGMENLLSVKLKSLDVQRRSTEEWRTAQRCNASFRCLVMIL